MLAAIAVLGYSHHWASARVFVGVRNVNEDFFTSPVTALFANSSCGIVPTIAASYPIANYPFSGLTFYFDVTRGRFTFRNSLCNGVGRNGWRHDDNPFLLRPKDDGCSICRSSNTPTVAPTILLGRPSTPASLPSTTTEP